MKNNNIKKSLLKAGVPIGFVVSVVCVGLILANTNSIGFEPMMDTKTWKVVDVVTPWLGWGESLNLTTNVSGFCEIFLVNISSNRDYNASNATGTLEGWARANMVGKTPYNGNDSFSIETESEKTFVVVVRARFNYSDCGEYGHFNADRCDVQLTMTCTAWALGANIANVSGLKCVSGNTSEAVYINFYWDNSGNGYQIQDDASWTISEIYIESKR